VTRKLCELTAVPLGVLTVSGPFFAPGGTLTNTCVSVLVENGLADVPLPNLTLVAPVKLEPLIVTGVPTFPEVGEIEVMVGVEDVEVTVKVPASTVPPQYVSLTIPVVAPGGTLVEIVVGDWEAIVAVVPLNATSVTRSRFDPVIVTSVFTGPLVGVKPETLGVVVVPEQPGSWNDAIRVSQSSSARVFGCAL
jgi:hypothetical protein